MRVPVRVLSAFVILGGLIGRAQAQTPAAKPVAVVNGESVSQAELEAAILMIQRGPSPVELTETKRREIRMQALGVLLDEILLRQFLRQHGPRIEPAEVDRRLLELEAALKKDGKTLADFYRETYQSEAQVRANTQYGLQWQAYVKNRLTEADLKRYYTDYKDFFDGVTVQAGHIVVRLPANAPENERQAARSKLLALRQEIVSGKLDFAEAARKHSQCPSAERGGDVGEIERKFDVDEAFARAAFALKLGEVSDVVQTDFGLHLIKMTKRNPGKPSEYDKVKDWVQEVCDLELRMAVIAQMRQAAKIEINLP